MVACDRSCCWSHCWVSPEARVGCLDLLGNRAVCAVDPWLHEADAGLNCKNVPSHRCHLYLWWVHCSPMIKSYVRIWGAPFLSTVQCPLYHSITMWKLVGISFYRFLSTSLQSLHNPLIVVCLAVLGIFVWPQALCNSWYSAAILLYCGCQRKSHLLHSGQ